MAEKTKAVYDESKIKTLSSLGAHPAADRHVYRTHRHGAHPDDGCYVLLKEVVDNTIDEYIMGHGKEVQITLEGSHVTVRDFGRGIPLGKVVDCVSKINTGAKYNDEVFQFSVGLNGVGTKAVNALSKNFLVRSHRDGEFAEASFKIGKLKKEDSGKTKEPNGTLIEFEPDPEIFKNSEFRLEHIERRLRHYSYLNTGLKLVLKTPDSPEPKVFQSRHGLMDLVMEDMASDGSEPLYAPLHYAGKTLEFCFTHSNSRYGETFYSFVNGQYTSDGGTHLSAFREGLLKAVNEYCNGKFEGDDVREAMVGAVAIRLKDPMFESQTKNKLGNTEIRTELVNNVREELLHFFQRNKQIAETIMAKVKDTQELRKELQNVKKLARDRAKSITLRIPQLKDCKNHFDKKKEKGKGTMVFICEGQSAAGSITSCRDVNNQAVFVLKGKPLNVWDLKRDVMYKNDEMYNLMQSLNVEDNTEGLRYDKVILATDADVDGMHIRNLMITYFFRFFEQLVHDGHVYVLETPLFRVRNKEENHLLLQRNRARQRRERTWRQAGDHAVQRLGRNQPEGIPAIHRQGNADEQSGICAPRRVRPDLQFLHGQKYARAERLHHGQSSWCRWRSEANSPLAMLCFQAYFFAMSFDTLMLEVESLPAAARRKLMAYMVALEDKGRAAMLQSSREKLTTNLPVAG